MADKYLYNNAGQVTEKAAIATSAGAGDAGKVVALDSTGKIAVNMMPIGSGPEVVNMTVVTDTLVAGDFVNITATGVRKADAAGNRPAHGFVLSGAAPAATVDVYSLSNTNTALTALTMGTKYFLGANGAVTATAPSTAGWCSQVLGVAATTTSMVFNPSTTIVLA